VAFIAHELRSPLMSAFLVVTTLRKKERPEDQWALGMLTRSLNALRELIDQVLTADRLENRAGFGLGLAIVKQALEAHGGRVSVRNAPGKGCVFSLELPDARETATEVREAMTHPDTAGFMSAQITIANWYLDRAAHAVGETSSR
jgi:signal transduction histidine kinase